MHKVLTKVVEGVEASDILEALEVAKALEVLGVV